MKNIMDLDNNVRGQICEELAKHYICLAIRCKYVDSKVIDNWKINQEQKAFIKKYWKYIDIIRFNNHKQIVDIYEIKSRKFQHISWKTHSISEFMLKLYKEAIRLGMKIKVFNIELHENWNFDFTVKEFSESDFAVSVKRGQRFSRR
ncbi:MAG: hypothetical protein U9R08_03365 [Nanoarchaeota archaeon]|nr:hypothetical protein [Nanoarchaeota archaeon]